MSALLKGLQVKISSMFQSTLLNMLSLLVGILVAEIGPTFLEKVLPAISKTSLLVILGILSLLLTVSLIQLRSLNDKLAEKIKKNDYEFDKRTGIYRHKSTKEAFCTSCLSDNVLSPLREYESEWCCQRKSCNKSYSNPDYNPPPRVKNPNRRQNRWWGYDPLDF